MASETEFLNDALGQIGAPRITNIDDGTVNANWCKTFWPPLRRAMLEMHRWNFADHRVQLAQEIGTPAFEFNFIYPLPADLLAIREYNGAKLDTTLVAQGFWTSFEGYYKVEGRKLYTNDGEAYIVYSRDVPNPDQWSALFYQGASAWLASKLALSISKDAGRSRELLTQASGVFMPLGMAVDGQQGTILPYSVPDLLIGR